MQEPTEKQLKEYTQTKPRQRNGAGLEYISSSVSEDVTLCNMMARKMMSSTSTLERPAAAPSAKPSAKRKNKKQHLHSNWVHNELSIVYI